MGNPLDHIVERTAVDPGVPFRSDVLASLARYRLDNRPGFETLRGQLKQAGCRVVELDKAIAKHNGETAGPTAAHTDKLLEFAQSAQLFHAPDGSSYADINVDGHRQTWPIRSRSFSGWLRRAFFEATQRAPSAEALMSAISLVEARAQFDSPERVVHMRVGENAGRFYLDLCDADWRAIEIDALGWRVVADPPVRFRRAPGMRPLPMPQPGGSIECLRSFLNIQADSHFVLVVAWALAGLRPVGPYPVLALSGEQGSAKSSFAKVLKALLDPNSTPNRSLSREERDLFIAASNGHVLAYDNISGLPAWLSDAICRLSTGGGFAVRKLCTDQDEVLFDGARPVILNGIEDSITRPDLADRAIPLVLQPIPESQRRSEKELWDAYEPERPRLLGALLDAMVVGIRRLPETRLEKLPRMADFALWATACETAFWPAGSFMAAYNENRDTAVEDVIEADPIGAAVRAFMASRAEWTGTATELLSELAGKAGERIAGTKTWPDCAQALSNRLRRVATTLRKIGIDICFERDGRNRTRTITIATRRSTGRESRGKQPSASSAATDKCDTRAGFRPAPPPAAARNADTVADDPWADPATSVRTNPRYWGAADGADAADDASTPWDDALSDDAVGGEADD